MTTQMSQLERDISNGLWRGKILNPVVQQIVDRLHVSQSNREVVRAIREAFKDEALAAEHKEFRHDMYRQGIVRHKRNRAMYEYVMYRIPIPGELE